MRIRDWDKNLKIRLFGESVMNITFWMFFPFLSIYFSEEFGKEKAGLLLVLSQLFSVFANLLGGYSADRFGRKRMMVISSFAQGIAFIGFAFANSPWFTSPWISFFCFSAVGFFGSFYWPASQAMVADLVDEKERSHVFAIFYTSINIAVVLGPILGAIFYVHYRFELLLSAGLISITLAFILSKWTRETFLSAKATVKHENDRWYHFLLQQLKDYKIIIADKTFLLFIVAGVLVAQIFMQLDLLIPVYSKDVIENQTVFSLGNWNMKVNGEQGFGLILAENGLLVALLTVFVTKWMNGYKQRNVFIFSSLMYAVSIFLFGQSEWIWGLILAMAIFTIGELMVAGIQQTFISQLAPEEMRGQYFAAASLRYTFGRTIAPLSIPMTVWIGYQWTFVILTLLAVISAVLYGYMFHVYEKKVSSQNLP
ncbi:MDR family MFS transporter [Neobacillus sp. D3-1R]|uniref:MDR family MFS transporter n=1 Tax=Neobacillus sp. D3-1R TaxID=3445778 RepID=UPI003FA15446